MAILLRLYVEVIGLRTSLRPLLLPVAKTSHHQIPAVDVLLAWWYDLALGAERFEHMTRYRRDPLLPRLLGLPRFPSSDTLRRFGCGCTYRRTTEVSEALLRMSLGAMRPILLGHTRRFVCLRQTLVEHPEARGRRLLECPGYTDRVLVTSVPFAAERGTRMYAGRADGENRIKELKEDLSLDTFCLQSFDATDAAARTGCVLYNPLMGFRETVLPSCWFERRLRAVRDRVFLVGADLIPDTRRLRVRFAVPQEERTAFLQRLRTLSEGLPIAAQVDWDVRAAEDADHAPARASLVPRPTVQPSPQMSGASPSIASLLRNPGSYSRRSMLASYLFASHISPSKRAISHCAEWAK